MGKLNKLLLIAVCCVVIATPIIRYKLKAQHYLESLSSGVVLEATQRLRSGLFKNTKVLLIDYLPEGSTGVVLNETIAQGIERYQKLKVSAGVEDRLNDLEMIASDDNDLYWGGPVAQAHVFWVGYDPDSEKLFMSGNDVSHKSTDSPINAARFAGYAGWRANQLEKEILKGDWRVTHVDQEQILKWLREFGVE